MKTPPFQPVDILFGLHLAPEPPMPGWYIYAPDREALFPGGKAGIMTADPNEASEVAEFIDCFSKYGHHIHDAWLHSHQRVFGHQTKQPCWTPR